MQTVGKKLRVIRRQKKWSQKDIARRLGISVPSYSKIETGITDVNLSRLYQIAQLLGLTVSELLQAGPNVKKAETSDKEIERNSNEIEGLKRDVANMQKAISEICSRLELFKC